MKHTICLMLIILAFLSCKKEEEKSLKFEKTFPGAMEWGWVEATRDGEPWQASAFAQEFLQNGSIHVGITFHTFSEEGFLREVFTIGEIPLKVGKYPMKGGNSKQEEGDGFIGSQYSWGADDGDVVGASYDHDDTMPGFLELTMVDTVARKIAGKFDRMVFKMRVTPQTQFAPNFYPQMAVFENGTFEMAIME